MKEFITRLFSDSEGNVSSMRIMYVFQITMAIAMGWYVLIASKGTDVGSVIAIIGAISGIAGGQKIFQNSQEKKKE